MILTLATVAGATLTGCNLPSPCTDELNVQLDPVDATLTVGASVTGHVRVTSGGGSKMVPVDLRWGTVDTTVVSVAEETGTIIALGPGNALVTGSDLGPYRVKERVTVPVQGPQD
jgi:hypothetical protein